MAAIDVARLGCSTASSRSRTEPHHGEAASADARPPPIVGDLAAGASSGGSRLETAASVIAGAHHHQLESLPAAGMDDCGGVEAVSAAPRELRQHLGLTRRPSRG